MMIFAFTLIAVFCTSLGSREQMLIARIAGILPRGNALPVTGASVSALTAAFMAWGGQAIAGLLTGSASVLLVTGTLLLAAVDLARTKNCDDLREPTRSLGAIAWVLLVRQVGDASRLVILAVSAYSQNAVSAGWGGALGGVASIGLAWGMAAQWPEQFPLRAMRKGFAAAICIAALIIGWSARAHGI